MKRIPGLDYVPVTFRDLAVGDRFQFDYGDGVPALQVFTKTSALGWYVDKQGGRWRTGAGTAVVKVEAR